MNRRMVQAVKAVAVLGILLSAGTAFNLLTQTVNQIANAPANAFLHQLGRQLHFIGSAYLPFLGCAALWFACDVVAGSNIFVEKPFPVRSRLTRWPLMVLRCVEWLAMITFFMFSLVVIYSLYNIAAIVLDTNAPNRTLSLLTMTHIMSDELNGLSFTGLLFLFCRYLRNVNQQPKVE
jgi:hypothetical protein